MSDDSYRRFAPAEWHEHWDAMPNAVRALYATLRQMHFPWITKEVRIEAWGQLCYDNAAATHTAYHMWNNGMRTGWEFLSWRVEMDGPLIGGAKLSGTAPEDFSFAKYGPPRS